MEDQDRKRIILILRWTAIIVTSYLILFSKGRVTDLHLSNILIFIYLLSNVVLSFFPKRWFSNLKLFYPLVLFDTGVVSFGMYLSEKMTTDFYLVFFLIIIFASISRNFKLLMVIGGITALLYGVLLYSWGFLTKEEGSSYTLRIPFIFIMTAFYGYIVQTLTKEKRQELTISEDKYRGLFENANDGIILLRNPELRIADVNREVEKAMQYTKAELLQKDVFDLFAPEEVEKARDYFKEVAEKEGGRTDHLSLMKKDGASLEVDFSIKRIDLGDESFYQIIFRDLTEQRKLEKKIRESKRNLEAIFDGIRDQVSIQAPDYRILRVNRAVVENYQITFEKLINRKCYEAYFRRSEPCERCPVSVCIETKQPASSMMKLSGDHTTLQIFSYPIVDEKGKLLSVIEYVKDVTQEQRLQEQLIQSEKLAGIGVLASGVAHEINNPLSGIIGMAEIALEEEDPSKKESYLTDILECGQRINEIVKGLRSYSRAAKKEEFGPVDLNGVLEESLKMVQLAIKANSVEVIKEFQASEKIQANVGEVQQVFTNLITNAFQAMDGKGGKLILSTRALEDFIEVKVSDNGTGIPQKYLNQIFDAFFTTKNPGEGTGLGLNIVYRIVSKYEGTIDVDSKERMGTTFTIKFPIWRAET
ncbi:MAG TPA: ATP-binding protein [Thermodesulfobacteriota bacterium]|nr:ATP-binding protein [Thermodesulfobacteriota bacterium]